MDIQAELNGKQIMKNISSLSVKVSIRISVQFFKNSGKISAFRILKIFFFDTLFSWESELETDLCYMLVEFSKEQSTFE